jgi:hypothetical protein
VDTGSRRNVTTYTYTHSVTHVNSLSVVLKVRLSYSRKCEVCLKGRMKVCIPVLRKSGLSITLERLLRTRRTYTLRGRVKGNQAVHANHCEM